MSELGTIDDWVKPDWIVKAAERHGWRYEMQDRGQKGHIQIVSGTDGPLSWTCALETFWRPGGQEGTHTSHSADFKCEGLNSSGAEPRLKIAEPHNDLFKNTEVDLAFTLAKSAFSFLKRGGGPATPGPTYDLRSRLMVVDPENILQGDVAQRYFHWPVLDTSFGPQIDAVMGKVGDFFKKFDDGEAVRPADAPPQTLTLSLLPGAPLRCCSADWWSRADFLLHQVELGLAVAKALLRNERGEGWD
jgi:hypothetical protein